MPCNCDHLEANAREVESSRVREFLRETAGKKFNHESRAEYYGHESAPKDGTSVLLWRQGALIQEGSWNRGGALHMPHWMTPGKLFNPTHWHPAPAPPLEREP